MGIFFFFFSLVWEAKNNEGKKGKLKNLYEYFPDSNKDAQVKV